MTTADPADPPAVSVVVPVHNEADNIRPLVAEIAAALEGAGEAYEMVYVDDGSRDATPDRLRRARGDHPALRVVRHAGAAGQSAAVRSGVKAARGRFVATLDGDGQNDPADIPALLGRLRGAHDPDALMVAGWRATRHDSAMRRAASRIANGLRRRLLGDDTPDTGCGLKVMTRDAFLDLPGFDHMHRFLPALMVRRGGSVESVAVNHRPRREGTSKYGIAKRAAAGVVDLAGVLWLARRGKCAAVRPTEEA
mgnify:CR=1 FL=1